MPSAASFLGRLVVPLGVGEQFGGAGAGTGMEFAEPRSGLPSHLVMLGRAVLENRIVSGLSCLLRGVLEPVPRRVYPTFSGH